MTSPNSGQSQEQIALERAGREVSAVLLDLEQTIKRTKAALRVVRKDGVDTNADLALQDLQRELDRARKRLQQDTYFAGDALRLI